MSANFVSFYKNALLYLACTPLSSIPLPEQAQLAHDLSLAALLGETIYNFGDLVRTSLLASSLPSAWADSRPYAMLGRGGATARPRRAADAERHRTRLAGVAAGSDQPGRPGRLPPAARPADAAGACW